jgi:hypothetical protein
VIGAMLNVVVRHSTDRRLGRMADAPQGDLVQRRQVRCLRLCYSEPKVLAGDRQVPASQPRHFLRPRADEKGANGNGHGWWIRRPSGHPTIL